MASVYSARAKTPGLAKSCMMLSPGHSGGGVGRSYGGGFGLKVLADAIGRIEVPEAAKSLVWASRGPNIGIARD